MRENTCDYCGGARFKRLPYHYTLEGTRIDGVRCLGCGLTAVSPMPGKDALARMYGSEYFKGDYHCGHREGGYEEEALTAYHSRVLEDFLKLKATGRLLEIGAAGGKFLLKARERGYEVEGVEVSPDACGIAEGLGLKLFCGVLEDAALPDGSFDAVYLGDVLEHLPKPFSSLKEIYRITAPGGVVGLSCPTNIGLISSRVGLLAYSILGRERAAPIPPYHLYEFTPGMLVKLIAGAGFEPGIVRAEIIPPWRIKLRGGVMEKAMKAAFHWPNYFITKFTGKMGDRVMVFARKR